MNGSRFARAYNPIVPDKHWLFPCDLMLTVRSEDGETYLAIHIDGDTQGEPQGDPPGEPADLWDEFQRRLLGRTED